MKRITNYFREKFLTPNKEQLAILRLAEYLENPNHADYKIVKDIGDILGFEFRLTPSHEDKKKV